MRKGQSAEEYGLQARLRVAGTTAGTERRWWRLRGWELAIAMTKSYVL